MGSSKRINFFLRSYLVAKGKRDVKNNVIRTPYGEGWTSPFVKEEVAACVARIHCDYEKYLKKAKRKSSKIKKLLVKNEEVNRTINNKKSDTDRFRSQINELSLDALNYSQSIFYTPQKTIIEDNTLYLEAQAFSEVIAAKKRKEAKQLSNSLTQNIQIIAQLEKKAKSMNALICQRMSRTQIEYEALIQKCLSHYSESLARLSAYWSGVLSNDSSNQIQSIEFESEKALTVIQREIEEIKIKEGE